MTPAAFSRLQLAAALLEYDNDPDNLDAPYRSAQDSAIFAHLRRNPAALPELAPRRSAHLGEREAALDTRRSRASKVSIEHLRNPFGADNASEIEDNEGEEGLEVDLASWGLDAFIPKDKAKSPKAKGKHLVPAVGSTRSRIPSTNHESSFTSPRRGLITAKSMSVGGHKEAFKGVELERERRRSFGSPLDLVGLEPTGFPLHRPLAVSQPSFEPSNTMVPFPTTSIRPPSTATEQAYLDPTLDQIYSMASMDPTTILDEGREDSGLHHRTLSIDTLGGFKPLEDNPFAIHHPSQISRFDPKSISRARSRSNASIGSRIMLDKEMDTTSVRTGDPYARERRYSTLELLRPKVLVMPSPLQPVSINVAPEPSLKFRDGFEWSADGPPLPPGARSSRRLSSLSPLEPGGENVPLASNSFTPNPLMDLTLSQKTFRNTLVVAGQSPLYAGFASDLPRAVQDGEQAEFDPAAKEEVLLSVNVDPTSKGSRPAGKLFGKSLIDDLENRKAQMRSKQRVFTGDQRPSMMARDQQRSSTLIDPALLQTRPITQHMNSHGSQNTQQGLARHPSVTIKPLLNFDGEDEKPLHPSLNANRLPITRSVFGVDTLWQREMAKLKELQAAEEQENADRRKREEEAERKKQEKKQRKNKKKGSQNTSFVGDIDGPWEPRISAEPPTLPNIQRASRRAPPKPSDSDVSSESDLEDLPVQFPGESNVWHSSDEDAGPRRTTGTGPRYPRQARKASLAVEDSEEDLPLAATIHKAAARAAFSSSQRYPLDSDDEDQPLSHVLLKAKSNTSLTQSGNNTLPVNAQGRFDEDDDQPLGLRVSRMNLNPSHEEEDDKPLAFHPEQQRKTQFHLLAQQQHQQQLVMQAQLQSSMMMNASMMSLSPGYYPQPILNPMAVLPMQVPMPIPSPPPMHDEAKYGRVDRWRRDVVVNRENK